MPRARVWRRCRPLSLPPSSCWSRRLREPACLETSLGGFGDLWCLPATGELCLRRATTWLILEQAWCRDCQTCQRGKVTKQPAAPLQPIPIPSRRFSHIHLDFVGPLPASREGHTHILTIIDRTTSWLEAIPLQSTSARACVDALVEGWIARFGVPAHITNDRGVQFTSEVWSLLCDTLGVTYSMTTSYHPQSNGMIERSHRQIKDSLWSKVAGQDWQQHLPWVLLGLRVAPKEDSGLSSAELVYGSTLTLPGDFLATPESPTSEFLQRVQQLQPLRTRLQDRPPQPAKLAGNLAEASHVYVRRGGAGPPLSPLYSGPYEVINRGPKTFTVLLNWWQAGDHLCGQAQASPGDWQVLLGLASDQRQTSGAVSTSLKRTLAGVVWRLPNSVLCTYILLRSISMARVFM